MADSAVLDPQQNYSQLINFKRKLIKLITTKTDTPENDITYIIHQNQYVYY